MSILETCTAQELDTLTNIWLQAPLPSAFPILEAILIKQNRLEWD